jgi:predicted Zn-dependent peptidase
VRKLTRKKKKFFQRSVLPNGIVVVTEPTRHFKSLAIGVWVKRGSRHETPSQAGMAHFLEHMMFKGTTKRSPLEIARDVDLVGGDFNAMTTREYTCFHLTLPANELDFALDLLTDILKDSKFDAQELERERGVILQEIPMTEESPEEYVYDVLFEKVFGKHPLGLPILGTIAHVKRFARKDVVEYFRRHYSSKNIVISLAGSVNHKVAVRRLTKHLADFKGKPQKMPIASLRKPKFHPGLYAIRKDMEQTHIAMACEAYPINHPKRMAQFLLNAYLGGSMSSALFQSIREQRGLAYSV